uniref:Uncharacterized protein n=1 Tax=Vespula pensylvanica TaxID=30213 RepID=A0A834U7L6_VESPE|nr:hypothetical protein H0235_010561 [Vespula pensylvanica]
MRTLDGFVSSLNDARNAPRENWRQHQYRVYRWHWCLPLVVPSMVSCRRQATPDVHDIASTGAAFGTIEPLCSPHPPAEALYFHAKYQGSRRKEVSYCPITTKVKANVRLV